MSGLLVPLYPPLKSVEPTTRAVLFRGEEAQDAPRYFSGLSRSFAAKSSKFLLFSQLTS